MNTWGLVRQNGLRLREALSSSPLSDKVESSSWDWKAWDSWEKPEEKRGKWSQWSKKGEDSATDREGNFGKEGKWLLLQILGLVPSSHTMTHNGPNLWFPEIQCPLQTSAGIGLQAHTWYTYTHADKTLIKSKWLFLKFKLKKTLRIKIVVFDIQTTKPHTMLTLELKQRSVQRSPWDWDGTWWTLVNRTTGCDFYEAWLWVPSFAISATTYLSQASWIKPIWKGWSFQMTFKLL